MLTAGALLIPLGHACYAPDRGLVDDRVVAVHDPDRRIAFVERGEPGVAHPEVCAGSANVGEEALGEPL